jgi:lipoprotein-releasing system permease protein
VGVGDKLRFRTAVGADVTLMVTGIFDLGSRGVNERNVYVALRTAQDLLNLPGGASAIDVTVDDIWEAEEVAQRIASRVKLDAQSWIRTNQQFFVALNAQTISNTVLRLSVGISVALGIASVLVVSVVQKSREIGILRAMGATRRQVMNVFLIQGAIVGFGGSLVGSSLAAIFLHVWGATLRNPDGTPLFMLRFDPMLLAWAAGVATITGLLAAVTPARRAAKLDPAVAIRA